MQKPPGTVEVKLRENSLRLIVPQKFASIKPSEQQRSRVQQQSDESSETFPPLPEHLDKLIDSPWTPEASRQIDLWLWYVQQEFETGGGTV